jgi:Domain of unknown function (DUF4132)
MSADPAHELDALVDALLHEKPWEHPGAFYGVELDKTKTGPKLLALDKTVQAAALHRFLEHRSKCNVELDRMRAERTDPRIHLKDHPGWLDVSSSRALADLAIWGLLRRKLPLGEDTLRATVRLILEAPQLNAFVVPVAGIAAAIENRAGDGPLSDELREDTKAAFVRLRGEAPDIGSQKAADRLAKLIVNQPTAWIDPGEAWSDAALADLDATDATARQPWSQLLASCQTVGAGKPSAKWLKEARKALDSLGHATFKDRILRWLPLVDRPRTGPRARPQPWQQQHDDLIEAHHVEILRGLCWYSSFEADRDLARALAALAQSAYRKLPGKGPRLISLGHAAIAALGAMPGMDAVGQLALLKVKVKFIPAQKELEKALTAAAAREGLPRDEVDELAVPGYGMQKVGHRREILGDFIAELLAEGHDVELRWSKAADGKPLKSVPAAAKKDHSDDVKELQDAAKDAGKMLTAQRERIDSLFLARKRWPLDAWRARYLDHPLVGVIARRLIWHFETEGAAAANGIWLKGQLLDVSDQALEGLNERTTVELWHPIGHSIEEVTAWRDCLDRHQIRQPFKQAHREVYVLTDAERNTRVYSNRFAAHILRQHQFHALCAARLWRDKLRLMFDDNYPPTSKDLPEWSLRAEFWVEGIGGGYGSATNDSGAYLHLATDQVRYYEIGAVQRSAHSFGGGYSPGSNLADAEPVPLDRIPPLVLSEILRDVDLFVGVASVGNDPNWADGGPDGRHVDYWNLFSFGDLSATGQTRKEVLQRVIPRLKIASRCSFIDKFLVVRGDLRTYKIHLGSGNILMEPNNQYLCIVPKRGASEPVGGSGVFLPFEGDNTLSVILSKAFLLADDAKIKDPSIISQIKR